MSDALGRALIDETQFRLLEEGWPRLKKCIAKLSEADMWYRPNEQSNAVGNLILHLCGNARQYIVSGLGGAPDNRERAREFSERGPISSAELSRHLDQTMVAVQEALDQLDPNDLLTPRMIQGVSQTPVHALVHVVEHFSYHVGQVTYIVKAGKGIDLAYYGNRDLNLKNKP